MGLIKRIREVSIAVRNLERAVKCYSEILGLNPQVIQEERRAPIQARWCNFAPVDGVSLALMESLESDSPVDRFIRRKGEGVFSITLEVSNVTEAAETLRSRGVQVTLKEPIILRDTFQVDRYCRIAKLNFIHPKSSLNGVLLELKQLEP